MVIFFLRNGYASDFGIAQNSNHSFFSILSSKICSLFLARIPRCHCVLRWPFEPSQNTLCDAVPYFLLVEMISRLPLSCLRPSLLKQSVRSVNATVAASTRCRGSNISKGWLETDQTVSYILAQENISRTSESRVGVTSQMKIWSALFLFEMDQSCRLEQFESGPKLLFGSKSHLRSTPTCDSEFLQILFGPKF